MKNSDNDGNITANEEVVDMLSNIMSEGNVSNDKVPEVVEETVTSENEENVNESDESNENEGNTEEVLPEKFKGKDTDEIVKSYLELEKKFHQVSQEKNDLYKQAFDKLVSDKKDDVNQEEIEAKEQEEFKESLKSVIPDDFIDNMISDPEIAKDKLVEAISKISETIADKKLEKAIKPLQQQIVKQDVMKKLNQFKQKYPDYTEYEKHIIDVFQRFPEIDDGSVSGLEKAYMLARTLAGNPVQKQQSNIKKKISAQTERSSSSSSKPQQSDTDDFRMRLLQIGKNLQGVY